MNARTFLDLIKKEFKINTDEELAKLLGASKSSIDKWIQRNKVPDKWKFIIKEKLEKNDEYQQSGAFKNNSYYHIINEDIYIDLTGFDHKEEIEEIIRLLPYAPGKFLEAIKEKLQTFEELSQI